LFPAQRIGGAFTALRVTASGKFRVHILQFHGDKAISNRRLKTVYGNFGNGTPQSGSCSRGDLRAKKKETLF